MLYAEVSKSQFEKIKSGKLKLSLPDGVEIVPPSKNRAYYLECSTSDARKNMVEYLEDMGICYQDY